MQNSNIKTKPVVFPLSEEKLYVTRLGKVVTVKHRHDDMYPFVAFNEHGEYFRTVTESGRWWSDKVECQSDIVAEVVPDCKDVSSETQWKFNIGDVLKNENNSDYDLYIEDMLTNIKGVRYYRTSSVYADVVCRAYAADYIEREFVKVG